MELPNHVHENIVDDAGGDFHGGGAGFTSELRLCPDAGLGIALAMNTMRMPATMSAAHRICEVALEAGVDRASTPSA